METCMHDSFTVRTRISECRLLSRTADAGSHHRICCPLVATDSHPVPATTMHALPLLFSLWLELIWVNYGMVQFL